MSRWWVGGGHRESLAGADCLGLGNQAEAGRMEDGWEEMFSLVRTGACWNWEEIQDTCWVMANEERTEGASSNSGIKMIESVRSQEPRLVVMTLDSGVAGCQGF